MIFIAIYLICGLLINFGINQLEKLEILEEDKASSDSLNQHLVILLWVVIFCSFWYYVIKQVLTTNKN